MKTLKFNSSSWHYQIAEFGNGMPLKTTDICQYGRLFVIGILKVVPFMALFALISYFLVDLVIGLGFSVAYWQIMLSPVAQAMGGVICLGILVTLIYKAVFAFVDYLRYRNDIVSEKPDGFVKNAYKSWKHKYCVRIEIVHD